MLWGLTLINGVRWSREPVISAFLSAMWDFHATTLWRKCSKCLLIERYQSHELERLQILFIKFETIHIVLDQIRPTSTCDLGAQRRAPFCEMQIGSLGCAWNSSYILGCSAVQEGGFTFHTSNLPALLVLIFRLVNSPSLWSTFIPPQFVLYFS